MLRNRLLKIGRRLPYPAPPPIMHGMTQPITIRDEMIHLDQLLKLTGVVGSGGQARMLVDDGLVRVNGEPETRRRRKLRPGDTVEIEGAGRFEVTTP